MTRIAKRVAARVLWAMANVPTRLSGIEGISIYMSNSTNAGKEIQHGARVKVDSLTDEFSQAIVSIAAVPRVVKGTLPARVRKQVFTWIVLNRTMLMQLWEQQIDQQQAMNAVKSVEHTKPVAFFYPSLEATRHTLLPRDLLTDKRALARRNGEEMAIEARKEEFYVHKVLGTIGEQVTRTGTSDYWLSNTRLEVTETKVFQVPVNKRLPPLKPSSSRKRASATLKK